MAGPKRPQDRVPLKDVAASVQGRADQGPRRAGERRRHVGEGRGQELRADPRRRGDRGDHVAAPTPRTRRCWWPPAWWRARRTRKGLKPKPWVKTSLAPGSQVVTEYLDKSGLTADLDALGFKPVGYGCTTCIGNSGPLDDAIVDAIEDNKLVGAAVLSGNRNFEGRVHANVRANYLASPPLVVAYALLGKMTEDITTEPLGTGKDGKPVYLKDIWPTNKEIADVIATSAVARAVPEALRRGVQGAEAVAGDRGRRRQRHLSLVRRLDLCAEPALFRGHDDGAAAGRRRQGRAHPGGARRLDHHRPHQPGRLDPQGLAGRRLPAGAPGAADGLQQLRRAARQPRSDDARHLRQHPHPQRDADRASKAA